MRLLILMSIALSPFFGGCATTPPMYAWGSYDRELLQYYQKPEHHTQALQNLLRQTQEYERQGIRIAPGVYADIGTLYLEAGDYDQAVIFYQKEHDLWPESRLLMQSLIKNAGKFKKGKT